MTEHTATTAIAPSPFVDEEGNPRNAAIKAALDQFWQAVKRIPAYVKLAAALARDPQIPASSKALLLAGGAYAVSPIDLVPGIIPVVGQLDDLYVMLTALQYAVKKSPEDVANGHLLNAGVSREHIEEDLAAVRQLVKEAAAYAAHYGLRAVKATGSRLKQWAMQYTRKEGSADDHRPV